MLQASPLTSCTHIQGVALPADGTDRKTSSSTRGAPSVLLGLFQEAVLPKVSIASRHTRSGGHWPARRRGPQGAARAGCSGFSMVMTANISGSSRDRGEAVAPAAACSSQRRRGVQRASCGAQPTEAFRKSTWSPLEQCSSKPGRGEMPTSICWFARPPATRQLAGWSAAPYAAAAVRRCARQLAEARRSGARCARARCRRCAPPMLPAWMPAPPRSSPTLPLLQLTAVSCGGGVRAARSGG